MVKILLRKDDVPVAIVTRAQELKKQAEEGIKHGFDGSTVGTTTNTIRKPSSPPGKEREE